MRPFASKIERERPSALRERKQARKSERERESESESESESERDLDAKYRESVVCYFGAPSAQLGQTRPTKES